MRNEPAAILRRLGAARRSLGHVVLALTPPPEPLCADCGYGLPQCECALVEEYWQDFLEANPENHNEILRHGREYFGWPSR